MSSLIDRLSAAKGWGIEAEFRQQAEAFPEERTVSQEEYDELVRDAKEMWQEYERERETAKADRLQLLKEAFAWRRLYHFERSYNHIYGSQIQLLHHLAKLGDTGASIRELYGFYARAVPPIRAYPFENYIEWLVSQELLEKTSVGNYRITESGVFFLEYIKRVGYTQLKLF